jgi:Ca-activated chloride channel homolog
MRYVLIISLLFIAANVGAQKANELIKAGNDYYRQQQYEQAEQRYTEAMRFTPDNRTAKFNLTNTIYRRGRNAEAIKGYEELTALEKDAPGRARAFYNKGAILSREKKLEESIEAYKNALRQDPGDQQARENLQKALLELKKKEPPKENKQDQKKKKKEQQQQKQKQQQQQPKMSQKEAEQRLKLMEQKEKEVQQRLQKEKAKAGGGQTKDW